MVPDLGNRALVAWFMASGHNGRAGRYCLKAIACMGCCVILLLSLGCSGGGGGAAAGGGIDAPSGTGSYFQVSPTRIRPGESAVLSWRLGVDVDQPVTIDNGVGEVAGDHIRVAPAYSRVYTLSAVARTGDIIQVSVPLSVEPEPSDADLYVSPTGDDTAEGSQGQPLATLATAVGKAVPGQTIWMRDGVYRMKAMLDISRKGTADQPYRIMAYPGEVPILDGTDMIKTEEYQEWTYLMYVHGASFWHIKGITFTRSPSSGIRIGESEDILMEQGVSSYCGLHSVGGTGLAMSSGSRIVFLNWDSHHNANRLGPDVYGNADGFGFGPTGPGCKMYGCRMWNNGDDGLDLYYSDDPALGESCWAFGNGIDDAQGSISGTPFGNLADGSGFKLGPAGPAYPSHRVQHCLAWGNKAPGFEDNGHQKCLLIHNNTSYNNGVIETAAVEFEFGTSAHDLRNNLGYNTQGNQVRVVKPGRSRNNSWDLSGLTITADDFETLDDQGMLGPRKPDGSLPDRLFLRLKAASDLVDQGLPGLPCTGKAPDLGAFERP